MTHLQTFDIKDEPAAKGVVKNSLVVSDGVKDALRGTGAYFFRSSGKAISVVNFSQDVCFGPLSANILSSLTSVVKHIIFPALKAQVSVVLSVVHASGHVGRVQARKGWQDDGI